MIRILVDACYTALTVDTEEELVFVYKTLSVEIPDTNANAYFGASTPRKTMYSFIRDSKFPTGLLSFLLGQLQENLLPFELNWAPGCATLPYVVNVRQHTFPHPLRENQLLLIEEAIVDGRGVLCAATSAGKTAMMAGILKGLGTPPGLIIVGSRSLVQQTRDEVGLWLGEPVGEISSQRLILQPPVVVGLVNSLSAASGEPWFKEFMATRKVVFCDEAHHVARSATFRKGGKVITKIAQGMWFELLMRCPAPNRYGVSATPLKVDDPVQNWRLVGATGSMFKNRVTSTALIDAGYAARPYIYFMPFKTKKLSKETLNRVCREASLVTGKCAGAAARYQAAVQLGIVECKERNDAVVDAASTLYAQGLKVLVFVEQVIHGSTLEAALRARGLPAAFISGKHTQQEQEALLAWLREPGARIMVSTRVLGEGVNVPALGALVFACGGKAFVKIFQAVGRVLRIAAGKDRCIVVLPDDTHNAYLKAHCEKLKLYLSAEPGYRVAVPGQSLAAFAKAVMGDVADAVGVE